MIKFGAALKQADAMLKKLEATRDELRLAKRAAINATIKGMRLDAGRMIRATIQVTKPPRSKKTPKKIIESRIKLFFANPRAMSDEIPGGKLLIKDIKIPIRWFGPKQIPKVVKKPPGSPKRKSGKKKSITTAKVMKGGSRGIYPKGFGPNTEKLGYTIWERRGEHRYPLKLSEGVNVAEIIKRIGGEKQLRAMAHERLKKNLKRRIDRIKFVKPRQKK